MVNWVYMGQVTGGGQGGRREVASEDGQVSVARWARPGSGKRNLGAEGGRGGPAQNSNAATFSIANQGFVTSILPNVAPTLRFLPYVAPTLKS